METCSNDEALPPSTSDPSHSSNPPPSMAYCSFAVTGTVASFQPIFICHDCLDQEADDSAKSAAPLCICQACADICHDGNDHDVEYVGMGPCYCDCDHAGTCSISQQSQIQAERLVGAHSHKNSGSKVAENTSAEERPSSAREAAGGPWHEAFDVPILHGSAPSAELVLQAQELIKHSKETFWIDKDTATSVSDQRLCVLEWLAWRIFEHHRTYYGSLYGDDHVGGAEWWVQVKDPSSSTGKDGAVDLHYDKDEALAEVFGLGSFPTLSTVTYLTASLPSVPFSPTIVFSHTYVQGEDDLIDEMLVSQPCLGKHLVFDGKLLHGAPTHEDLREAPLASASPAPSDLSSDSAKAWSDPLLRVTFLVNIWHQKPAKVQPLPNEIRHALLGHQPLESPFHTLETESLLMSKKEVPRIVLEKDEDLPEHLRHRIELPFVSKGATWEDQLLPLATRKELSDDQKEETTEPDQDGEDDDVGGGGLVVVTFPPPPSAGCDTLVVKFGPGLQAYFDYPYKVSQPSEDEAMESSQRESGYV